MSTLDKVNALLTSANSVTGESRETLTEAMQDLVDGYGQGGGGTDGVYYPFNPTIYTLPTVTMTYDGSEI